MKLACHVMAGFDKEKARKDLNVPAEYSIEVMVAVGHPGMKELLSAELQEQEFVLQGAF